MLAQLSAEYFARSPLLIFPAIALGMFLVVFIIVTLRALFTRTEHVQRMAALPIAGSESEHRG